MQPTRHNQIGRRIPAEQAVDRSFSLGLQGIAPACVGQEFTPRFQLVWQAREDGGRNVHEYQAGALAGSVRFSPQGHGNTPAKETANSTPREQHERVMIAAADGLPPLKVQHCLRRQHAWRGYVNRDIKGFNIRWRWKGVLPVLPTRMHEPAVGDQEGRRLTIVPIHYIPIHVIVDFIAFIAFIANGHGLNGIPEIGCGVAEEADALRYSFG